MSGETNETLHLGQVIPPWSHAALLGEVGPGSSQLDESSCGPENDFAERRTTFMTWSLLYMARMINVAGGIPTDGNQRRESDAGCRLGHPNPLYR